MAESLTNAWLKCSIEPGMLPGEHAVSVETVSAGTISCFAQVDALRVHENLMSVQVLDGDSGSGILVRLPAQPFEISSRNVRVPANGLACLDA